MRTYRKVTTLSLSLLLGACSGRQQQTAELPDDLKKDLAAASAAGNDLAIAPPSRRSVRFVSDIEQWKGGAPVKRAKASHHTVRPTVHRAPAQPMMEAEPSVSVASASSAPAPITVAPAPEPASVIAATPSPEPSSAPVGSGSDGRTGDRGQGGGIGGLLGGIIGTVVLRGGHGGIDKCDTRGEGRARPPVMVTDVGDFGLPLPTGGIFGSGRRR
jgi:hypothetical protein